MYFFNKLNLSAEQQIGIFFLIHYRNYKNNKANYTKDKEDEF